MAKDLRLGIYSYETTMGPAHGWRLVELLPWNESFNKDTQPTKQLATSQRWGSRDDAIAHFQELHDALVNRDDVIVEPEIVSLYGWVPRQKPPAESVRSHRAIVGMNLDERHAYLCPDCGRSAADCDCGRFEREG